MVMQNDPPGYRWCPKKHELVPIKGYVPVTKKASEVQLGGRYVDMAIQVSEFCQKNKLSHLASQVVKYVVRADLALKDDRGLDLKKAHNCLDLLEEWGVD